MVVQGKRGALADPERRVSNKAKAKADLIRSCESYPRIAARIPPGLLPEVDPLR
jgi:hypothetical protein